MCDKELLIGYLYGELRLSDREGFERHLASCADCRAEVEGLTGTRAQLQSWTPPAPALGFEVVRRADSVESSTRRWRVSPAWGLAAAAMFVGAISAAIANVEVTVGRGGVTMRTGWHRAPETSSQTTASAATSAELERVTARLHDLETRLATVPTTPAAPVTSGPAARMSDAELIRTMRTLIDQSEERQQGVLARQILQVSRDFEVARRTDLDRFGRGMEQMQRTSIDLFQRQKTFEDYLVRASAQQR